MSKIHIPTKLYKYQPPDRKDFFDNFKIRFSQLSSFNDPFDGNPNITQVLSNEDELDFLKEVSRGIDKESIARLLKESHPESIDQLKLIELSCEKLLPDLEKYAVKKYREESRNTYHKNKDEQLGALCLTETPDNPLMWAHYAQNHTGFIIEFDGHNSFFQNPNSIKQARRVIYLDKRPSGKFSDLESNDLFFTKSMHWNYEKEWRMLQMLSDAVEIIQVTDYPVHLFNVPKDTIKSIIFGCRSNPSFIEEITTKVKFNPELSNVSIKHARIDNSHYLINIHDTP